MAELEFHAEPPPQARVGRSKLTPFADELRDHAGQWAIVANRDTPHAATTVANSIRQGKIVAFRPAGSFEVTVRDCDVWARYIETHRPTRYTDTLKP